MKNMMVYNGKVANEMTRDELIVAIWEESKKYPDSTLWAMKEAFRCGFLDGEAYAEGEE